MSIIDEVKALTNPSHDYIYTDIIVSHKKIFLIYNEVLCDILKINEFINNYLIINNKNNYNYKIINKNDIIYYLNMGYLIVINDKIYAYLFSKNIDRGISTINSELSLTGPKDSFNENYNTNLGLLRKRINDSSFKCFSMNIGKYTKTKIGICYIDNIVKMDLVYHIIKKLKKINIDGIIDSSYIKSSLEKKNYFFPTIQVTERPDKSCMALLEGKVVIIVDNSPYVLILPSFFFDFFHTTDDYYQKNINTSFIRIIRFIAFIISIYTPALFIAITTRNYNLVSFPFLLFLRAIRSYVPFPTYIEAFIMICCFEILKESDIRMSTTTSSSISILGGLILGDAAVAAGLVSPIMIIVIAISSIAGLIFPSVELSHTLRIYKLLLLIFSSYLGFLGIILGTVILFYNLFSIETFGYNYLLIDKFEYKDYIFKFNSYFKKRNSHLTNNVNRGHL